MLLKIFILNFSRQLLIAQCGRRYAKTTKILATFFKMWEKTITFLFLPL
jgi:hypothetical protein